MSSVDAPFKYLVKMFETGDIVETVDSNQAIETSLHERFFRQLSELYNHPKNGLISIGLKMDIDVLPPKKKITILLVGNHSAGKSSFINWYIEDNVQRTGMAIETQSFSVVASGRKRETLMGPATVFLFPHLKPLEKIEGIMDNLNAEISTSKKRQFSMLTFIDTPGLVDGSMEYPYNVDDAILFLGGVADLIFVFFDPIGLALCKRTMLVIEKINSLYPEKLRFYLSKSDEIRRQTDKQKIMMQITQEVCRHNGLNRSGFTMPGIYIPTLTRNPIIQKQSSNTSGNLEKSGNCQGGESHNEIEEVCKQIDQSISRALQIALNKFDKDINTVLHSISHRLVTNKELSERNWTCLIFFSVAIILLVGMLCSSVLNHLIDQHGVQLVTSNFHVHPDILHSLTVPAKLLLSLSAMKKNQLCGGYFILFLTGLYFFIYKWRLQPTLPRREVKELERLKIFITSYLMKKRVEMIEEYLGDSYDL
uniref:Dynamin N-terminal domain-containing protein n=2 Tax=Graphocephala atropunctata TaxID=36148 RepID=A0A1B6MD35_9HEMI